MSPVAATQRHWAAANSFAYQLQNVDVEAVHRSPYDLIIIDYSADGGDARAFTPAQVKRMQSKPGGGRRLVLAYLSVGEAEEYRFYWRSEFKRHKPAWLEAENPEWQGNYKARYWDPKWQGVLLDYSQKIVSAGFDGLYLDLVDAYEYFEEQRPSARTEMRGLVQLLARTTRAQAGADFGIFAQNAEALLQDPHYLHMLTGVGREETYFGLDGDNRPTPAETTNYLQSMLDRARQAGKLVLSLDYTTRPEQMRAAEQWAHARGYMQFSARRPLDSLPNPLSAVTGRSPRDRS